ncbi:Hpt domain-containing protein [Polaribacter gochangensis]|uniref:Hpt domain-containing protein n=1 Tax=Polaribacter gochangensis TaxID=3252903 RepID=UPI003904B041
MSSQDINKSEKNLFSSKVVDLSYLDESLSGDLGMLKQMIQLFLDQSPEKIKLLDSSVSEKKFEVIKETSHFLKSTFSIMGLQSKDDLAEIERLSSQQKDHATIVALNKKIMANFEVSLAEYKKIISSL